jgi:ABC-type transport system involved in cytochrome bd biosynthesis, ATPase and permease components
MKEKTLRILLENCNNIDCGNIEVKEKTLNIKYAINGTGKSTISKALVLGVLDRIDGKTRIHELTPFKHLSLKDSPPKISGIESLTNIKVFDEKYINEFVFQADELVKGSFEIFVKDESYDKGMQEIDALVEKLKSQLAQDQEIEGLIKDFNEISDSFGKETKTGIHASSVLAKAFKSGNKVTNIPEGLELYKNYIQHPENYKWLKWQLEGNSYLQISEDCPFCVSDIRQKKDLIEKVSENYEHKSIENLAKIVATFQRLNAYFSDDTRVKIDEFVKNVDGYSEDQVFYLRQVKEQIDRLNDKFIKASKLGFSSLKDVNKVIEGLKEHKIDIHLYVHLNSESTNVKVKIVNDSLDSLIVIAADLQKVIDRQKIHIQRIVEHNKKSINEFLKNAGYGYEVDLIEQQDGSHKLKLLHKDMTNEISNVKTHLSFGERNAFSLVLFMFDALKSKSDLIILDDPISSFDKNKKFAILEMLFRKAESFRNQTVLLLTHDFEPVVDAVYLHREFFSKIYASFLENKHGVLAEKEIERSDIKTYLEINVDNFQLSTDSLSKLVYRRKHLEMTGEIETAEYNFISSLFHRRNVPTNKAKVELNADQIKAGTDAIAEYLPDFSYSAFYDLIINDLEMKKLYQDAKNNYEKLHIYRIIFDGQKTIVSDVIQKFINEVFHIENNYIYQLNPSKYPVIPQYVIDECDKFIEQLV